MMDEEWHRDYSTVANRGVAQDMLSPGAIAGRNEQIRREGAAQEAQRIADNAQRTNEAIVAAGKAWTNAPGTSTDLPEGARLPSLVCGVLGALALGLWGVLSGGELGPVGGGILGVGLGLIGGALFGQLLFLVGAVFVGLWRAVRFLGWRGMLAIGTLVAGGFIVREISKTRASPDPAPRLEVRPTTPVRTPPLRHHPVRSAKH